MLWCGGIGRQQIECNVPTYLYTVTGKIPHDEKGKLTGGKLKRSYVFIVDGFFFFKFVGKLWTVPILGFIHREIKYIYVAEGAPLYPNKYL